MFIPIELSPGEDVKMGTPVAAAAATTEYCSQPGCRVDEIASERVVQLGCRDRAVQAGPHEEVPNVRIRLEQHRRRKQHVVDPNDAVLVQLDVVDEGRTSVQREVQRVVQVVIQIGAGADHEVDEPALHQLDHAAAETGRRQRAGHREPDRRVVLGQQHLVGEDATGFAEPRGVECLEAFVDEVPDVRAAARPVVPDGLAAQVVGSGFFWCTGGTVGHQRCSLAPPPHGTSSRAVGPRAIGR